MMEPLEATKEIFQRFGNKDVDGIVELLDDNAVIEFYGPETIPYAGFYSGKAQCRTFFETVLSSVEIHVFDAEEFICEGNRVVVVGRLHLTTLSAGAEIKSTFAHIIDCNEGRWIRFRDFMNTYVAAKAFSSDSV